MPTSPQSTVDLPGIKKLRSGKVREVFDLGIVDGELLWIDECLTPDSSRFWPKDQYVVGQSPPSFDKQFVRDYLETLDWDKTPPAPRLPKDVIEKTSAKYLEAFRRLTGNEIANT
jgi:phosphoribosylaminoimidazole-succinocarboxamide synthase